ncbi:MAG: DUF1631 family protein [Burkholderiaceae bacterium]|nr:DUF1631 family protein [Burkholderiaceae bacterium]
MPTSRSLLFARTRESLADALSVAATDGLPAIAHELEAAAEHALDGRDRQSLFAAATRLRREASMRVTRVADALAQRALRCLEHLRREGGVDEPGALALLDDEELEAQILAADLARLVRERAGSAYPRYVARLRAICDVRWRDDDINPLGARTLAAAALAALGDLADDPRTRAVIRQLALKAFTAPIVEAIEAAGRRLEQAGVPEAGEPDAGVDRSLPGARAAALPEDMPASPLPATPARPAAHGAPTVPDESAAQDEPAGVDQVAMPGQPGDATRAFGALAQADRDAATLGSSPLADRAGGEHLRVLPVLQPVLDIERDAVAFAHAIGAMPYSRQARGEFFGNVRARLRESGAAPAQVAVVDVVAAMFDYVIDDRRLPEAAKPRVWRLQQPVIALSLLDPAYLGDDPRALRRLIEHFGAISTAFSQDIARGSELYRRLDTVVRAVEIVTSALQSRSAVMAQQVEKEYSRAARSVGQLIERVVRERRALEETPGRRNRRDYARRPDREREKQVTERLHEMLSERLDRHQAPDSVREFVASVWLRHLRTAALRNGEESAAFRVSMQVVDDLLWSLESGERRSRRELAQRIPPLIRLMTQGVREIGARDEEFKSFFDELFLIHLRRMQRRERERGASTRIREADGEPGTSAGTGDAATPGVPTLKDAITTSERPASQRHQPAAQSPGVQPAPETPSSVAPPSVTPSSVTPSSVEPSAAVPPATPREGEVATETEGSERRLIEILESLDLADLPAEPLRQTLTPAQACAQLVRGDWIELSTRKERAYLKVAWINHRRTVALLVRHADRRATSLRMDELRERFAQQRAFIVP